VNLNCLKNNKKYKYILSGGKYEQRKKQIQKFLGKGEEL
jgi:hypothetical protein